MLAILLFQLTGMSLFTDRLFRAGASSLLAAVLVFVCMPRFIEFLQQIDATSDFDTGKHRSPPIFGGMLLVISTVIATLAFAQLNAYSISILIILSAYAAIGFMDDAVKIRAKRLVAQGKMTKADYQDKADGISSSLRLKLYFAFSLIVAIFAVYFVPGLNGDLQIPFIKPATWLPQLPIWAYVLLISFVTTATANGANFTDGMDTLVSIPIITTSAFVAIVSYISGNAIFSQYLLIPHMPGVDELMPIACAIIGATLAYLWFNCPPAQIYMGDGGSIGMGGAIGMMFVLIRAELFLPIVGLIFVAEAVSVVLQISGFKLTRRFSRDRTGRRLFLRAPLHEHFKLKFKERFAGDRHALTSKIVWRFHLISIIALIVGCLVFFKIR